MNRCASKPPLSHGQKLAKLWAGQFYLSAEDRDELAHAIESGCVQREEQAIHYIEEHGEWLDG